ncbi:DUF6457 domain-containing protein [Curtobacterium sp. ISL-83]|uniref:DUF6457 domain-containing protein n=1 Tax=Curtobacterium sp. ISL-83 TaxID=2819145 RepID=UPI001BE9D89F|nr:DUF6457 domain-containing protein [Curtobacterium sp. ISL-83]MBT2502864.1 hypothetical protein [Curtobacterium sp. ISL-83]
MTHPAELDTWAAELQTALGIDDLVVDVDSVVNLARDAARGVARPAAPLTAYISGVAVGRGMPLADALNVVGGSLPTAPTA